MRRLLVRGIFPLPLTLAELILVGPSRAPKAPKTPRAPKASQRRPSSAGFVVEIPVRPRARLVIPSSSGRAVSASAPVSPALAARAALPSTSTPAVPGAASFRPPVLEPAPLHGSPVLADLLAWRSEVFASSIECAVAAAGQASVAAERDAAKAVLASLELRVAVAADRLQLARQRNDIARDNVNSLQVELERVMARRRASVRRDDVSEGDDDDDDRGDYALSEGARSDVPEDEDELAGGGDSDEVDADIAGMGSGDMDLS